MTTLPRTHDLKTWPAPFAAVDDCRKRFEFRRADRPFAVGDTLRLREWDPGCTNCGADHVRVGGRAMPVTRKQIACFNDGAGSSESIGYTGRECLARVLYIVHGPAFDVPDGFCVMSIEVTS